VLAQHEAERERIDEEIQKISPPPAKFSVGLLNDRYRLTQLIKNKKFTEAKKLKEDIQQREEEETYEWQRKFYVQLEKRKELLYKRQRTEYETLKARLEKSINSKLKQRMNEYEKLLQRIQNLQNELIIKQSLQFSKIQSANAKLLAKYSLNLRDLEERICSKISRRDKLPSKRNR
jgi:hypothetical protein